MPALQKRSSLTNRPIKTYDLLLWKLSWIFPTRAHKSFRIACTGFAHKSFKSKQQLWLWLKKKSKLSNPVWRGHAQSTLEMQAEWGSWDHCVCVWQRLVAVGQGAAVFTLQMLTFDNRGELDWYGSCCDTFCVGGCDPIFAICLDEAQGWGTIQPDLIYWNTKVNISFYPVTCVVLARKSVM